MVGFRSGQAEWHRGYTFWFINNSLRRKKAFVFSMAYEKRKYCVLLITILSLSLSETIKDFNLSWFLGYNRSVSEKTREMWAPEWPPDHLNYCWRVRARREGGRERKRLLAKKQTVHTYENNRNTSYGYNDEKYTWYTNVEQPDLISYVLHTVFWACFCFTNEA